MLSLYFANPSNLSAVQKNRLLSDVLNDEERNRFHRFKVPNAQEEFLAARSLLRFALSKHLNDASPESWRFAIEHNKKPKLFDSDHKKTLKFNVSHTRNLVMVGVSEIFDVGVDAEFRKEKIDISALATRFFSPKEVAELEALQGGAAKRRFFDLWALKESWMKATGLGMSLPLERFGFGFDRGQGDLALSFFDQTEMVSHQSDWSFALLDHSSSSVAVTVVEQGFDFRKHTQCFRWNADLGFESSRFDILASSKS